MLAIRVGILKMLFRMANSEDPDQNVSESSLIWVCAVSLGLSVRLLVLEILKNLQ